MLGELADRTRALHSRTSGVACPRVEAAMIDDGRGLPVDRESKDRQGSAHGPRDSILARAARFAPAAPEGRTLSDFRDGRSDQDVARAHGLTVATARGGRSF